MANTKAVSNEEIVAALLQHGTVKAAAAAIAVAPRTIYDRMKEREFRAAYMDAKNEILRQAVFSINSKLAAAIDVIAEIMNCKENAPAVRLTAAQVIINNAGKFAERLANEEKETRATAKNPLLSAFDFD